MDFEKIESLCAEKGITIAALERETKLGNGTIRNWKKGGKASFEYAARVSAFLGVPMESLLKENERTGNLPS